MDHPLVIHIPLSVISETEPIKLKVIETGGSAYPVYHGETRITPKCYEDIELETARKTVLERHNFYRWRKLKWLLIKLYLAIQP